MKYTFSVLFIVSVSNVFADNIRDEVSRKRRVCPSPFSWLEPHTDLMCARRREACYSGYWHTDSCREKLACRVKSRLLGPIFDDTVKGICTRKPRGAGMCKYVCGSSRTKCYLHAMVDSDGYGVDIYASDRFYTTCACYQKCYSATARLLDFNSALKMRSPDSLSPEVPASPSVSPSSSSSRDLDTVRPCNC